MLQKKTQPTKKTITYFKKIYIFGKTYKKIQMQLETVHKFVFISVNIFIRLSKGKTNEDKNRYMQKSS